MRIGYCGPTRFWLLCALIAEPRVWVGGFVVGVDVVAAAVDGCEVFPEATGVVSPLASVGPRPSLIMARESGVTFVCQPLSA